MFVFGGQGDVNEELKFCEKIFFFFFFFLGGGVGLGGQGGCERRIEVFVKIQKKKRFVICGEGEGWGVRVDVNEELKFLGNFTKTIRVRVRGGGGSGQVGSGWWGGGGQGEFERNVGGRG